MPNSINLIITENHSVTVGCRLGIEQFFLHVDGHEAGGRGAGNANGATVGPRHSMYITSFLRCGNGVGIQNDGSLCESPTIHGSACLKGNACHRQNYSVELRCGA